MPSWLARKLNQVASRLTGAISRAHPVNRAVLPETKECSTSGGSANW
jgi:hypothetical protein